VAAGRLLHAELAVAVPRRPAELDLRDDRWASAERFAFDEAAMVDSAPKEPRLRNLVRRLAGRLTGTGLGAEQLVPADLAGNVLLDAHGSPVVIDLSPAWRPPRWAEAVCALDAVLWHGAPAGALARWRSEAEVDALVRAAPFRLLRDDPPDVDAYARVLAPLCCELTPVGVIPGPPSSTRWRRWRVGCVRAHMDGRMTCPGVRNDMQFGRLARVLHCFTRRVV